MTALITTNFLEIISAFSSLMVLATMIYFVTNITLSIEKKVAYAASKNKDLELKNIDLMNKLNTYNEAYKTNEKNVIRLMDEKDNLQIDLIKYKMCNEYSHSLKKENQALALKIRYLDKKLEREREYRIKEERKRKDTFVQESRMEYEY